MVLVRSLFALLAFTLAVTSASAADDAPMHPVAAGAAAAVADSDAPFVMAVRFLVREGLENDFIAAMADPCEQTAKESGNLAYELSVDPSNARAFLLYEKWENVAALDSHLKQPYLVKLGGALGDLLSEPPSIAYYVPVD